MTIAERKYTDQNQTLEHFRVDIFVRKLAHDNIKKNTQRNIEEVHDQILKNYSAMLLTILCQNTNKNIITEKF